MAVNIEKMRADMRWESRKFLVSAVLAAAALVGAGIAIGNYFSRPSSAPQILFQSGSIVVQTPGAASR